MSRRERTERQGGTERWAGGGEVLEEKGVVRRGGEGEGGRGGEVVGGDGEGRGRGSGGR